MTNEQKQIAIAEFDGWEKCRYVEGLKDVLGIPPKTWKGDCISGLDVAWTPPYLTSRDAICKAVEKLNDWDDDNGKDKAEYSERLAYVVGANWASNNVEDRRRIFEATAAQMADALLLTLGHEI